MRKALTLGLPLLAVVAAGGAWLALHESDPTAAARRRMDQGNMRGAELYLRQAVRTHPDAAEPAFLLGKVDLALGNPEAAELELRRALARGYPRRLVVLQLGEAYLQQRHFDAALRDFTPESAAPDTLADTLTIRAAAQLSLGDTKAAVATIAQAEAAGPPQRETLLTAARVALAADDLAGASARTAKILATEPNQPEAVLLDADIDLRRNDAKAALAAAEGVLAASPNRLDARMIEARAQAALGHIDAARASVQRVLRGSPKNVSANYLEAMLAIQQGDYGAADNVLTTINTVIDQLPRGEYFLAVTKLGVGQPAQAEEAISKFLAHAPDDEGAIKLLAFIDLSRHHPEKVLALLRSSKLTDHPDAQTLDLQGRAQAMQGNSKAAEQSLSAAAKLAPTDVQILNRLAAAELSRGETGSAELELRHSLSIAPNQRLAGEAIVQADLARGDVAAATKDVETLRQRIGDAEEVGVLAAQVRIAGLDMQGGERQLRDVLKRFPESRPAQLGLVRIYGLRGDSKAAIALLEDMVRHHPDDEAVLNVLLPALLADKQADHAVAVAEAAHEAAPNNAAITADLASTYVRVHQPGRAEALLDRASAGSNPALDVLRARVLAANGQTDKAVDAYNAAIRATPADLRPRIDLAGLLVSAKRYDAARATLRDALQKNPGNPDLLGDLVGVDLKAQGPQAALATAAVLRTDPQNLPAAEALPGDIWSSAGDMRQASAAYLAAYRQAPSGVLAIRAANALAGSGQAPQARSLLGAWVTAHPADIAAQGVLSALELRANDLVDAEQHLDAVLAVAHDDVATLNNLAWIKEQRGDHAEARTMAERAYFTSPAAPVADTLGWILARQGDTANALMLLSQAVANQQGAARASAAYHYGWALNAAGRNGEARTQLQAALAETAEFPERDDATRLLASLR